MTTPQPRSPEAPITPEDNAKDGFTTAAAITKGMKVICISLDQGELDLDGTGAQSYWAFEPEEGSSAGWLPGEIFCRTANCPADLTAGARVEGTVDGIRITDDGRPDVFLSSVERA